MVSHCISLWLELKKKLFYLSKGVYGEVELFKIKCHDDSNVLRIDDFAFI